MALTLNDLNDDVLIEVYKWLIAIASNDHPEVWDDDDNRLRRAEITSLSCVNVKFRRIAVPLLFSHVNFERTGYRSASEYEEFVSVFKGNGSLQSTVKRVTFTAIWHVQRETLERQFPQLFAVWSSFPKLNYLDIQGADCAVRQFQNNVVFKGPPLFPALKELKMTFRDAFLARHCPNLEVLSLQCISVRGHENRLEFNTDFEHCMATLPPLKSLKLGFLYMGGDLDVGGRVCFVDADMIGVIIAHQPELTNMSIDAPIFVALNQFTALLARMTKLKAIHLPRAESIVKDVAASNVVQSESLREQAMIGDFASRVIAKHILEAHSAITNITFAHDGPQRKVSVERDWEGKLGAEKWVHTLRPVFKTTIVDDSKMHQNALVWLSGPGGRLWRELVGLD